MPACDAAYFVILSDGDLGSWARSRSPTTALLGYVEQRLPDEFGDLGRLVSAKLGGVRWLCTFTDPCKLIRNAIAASV